MQSECSSCLRLSFEALPYPIRAVFAAIMFAEASLLMYGLAVRFPLETHVYAFLSFLLVLNLRHILLLRRPNRREYGRLKQTLNEFKRLTGLGEELKLEWKPEANSKLSGEVVGNTIRIYDEDYNEARKTLAEEFMEYLIFKASKPYINLLNAMLKGLNEEAYRERDKIAKALSKLLLTLTHTQKNRCEAQGNRKPTSKPQTTQV